jgi:hypothetical protein
VIAVDDDELVVDDRGRLSRPSSVLVAQVQMLDHINHDRQFGEQIIAQGAVVGESVQFCSDAARDAV